MGAYTGIVDDDMRDPGIGDDIPGYLVELLLVADIQAKASAVAAPMPDAAPVMKTLLPLRFLIAMLRLPCCSL